MLSLQGVPAEWWDLHILLSIEVSRSKCLFGESLDFQAIYPWRRRALSVT